MSRLGQMAPRGTVESPPAAATRRPKILYLVTEDWYFCSHRLPVARAAREAGYDVVVATRVRDHGAVIEREGFRLVPIHWSRRSLNPVREARAIIDVARLYRRERPDLAHHVAIKPVVYGSIAARAAGLPAAVNTLAGLGYVFTSREWKARILGPFLRRAIRWLASRPNTRVILQNPDDERVLRSFCGPRAGRLVLIRGSGVDVERFAPRPEPKDPVVTMVSRMLWNKGVGDLVEAAKLLRAQGEAVRILLVGKPDPENPASVPESQLARWQYEGIVEYRGYQEDIPAVWAASTLAVLPTTYGEGVPKALLEAAACARAIVATDTPGCREIVRHGENGLLVPVKDPAALAGAIARLLRDPEGRRAMGARGRALAIEHFTEDIVVRRTLELYESLRPDGPGR